MPDRPETWEAIAAWLESIGPALYAPALSAAIAVLRVVYGGGSHRQMLLEGALCGLVTLALKPALVWLGLPEDLAVFIGACVGFVGVEKLREWAIRVGEKRVDQ